MAGPGIKSTPGLLFVALLFAAGCGTYRNMTAYFNTYYNASKIFDDAVAEVNKAPQPARDSNYFAPYKVSQGTVAKFEKVIEKGSKVIQFHGESGYVEDAILMIGKSYLYQNETESAASKFRELLENFPASDKRFEAKLWYARALYQGNKDQESLVALKELTGEAGPDVEIDDDILMEAAMLEAQIYEDRGEYDQAALTLGGVGERDGNAELKTVALYQLGNVYEKTGNFDGAARAFSGVLEQSPTAVMRFNAMLRRGVMLSKAGDSERALETFDEIIEWPLKPAESALVDYEIATAYWQRGDSASAFTLYAIIDSTYKKTDASARANYTRAEIMRSVYGDFSSAKKYYEKAKTEYPASPVTPLAGRRFLTFDHYFKTYAALTRDDSLFTVALHSDSGAAGQVELVSDSGGAAGDSSEEPVNYQPPPEGQSLGDRNPAAPPDPRNLGQMLAGENLDMRALRLRPRHLIVDVLEQNLGLRAEGTVADDAARGTPRPGGSGKGEQTRKPQQKQVAKKVEKLSPEQLSDRMAAHKYELGGLHFLDLELPDSALYWYRRVVQDHPKSPLVAKALYAMSEVYRGRGDTDAVGLLQDALLTDYPESEYSVQILRSRGLDTVAVKEDPRVTEFRRAEELLVAHDTVRALRRFKKLYGETKDTLIAPKVCYTIGWIYENVVVDLDSAGRWYRMLIRDYPKSEYAAEAVPRVAVKDDTSKLGQYVKFNEIQAVPKPVKKNFGLIRKEGQLPAGTPPGQDPFRARQAGQGKMVIDPNEVGDEEEEEEEVDETDPDEEEEEEDDPGDDDSDPGAGRLSGPNDISNRNIPT